MNNSTLSSLRKRWPVLATVIALAAVALTAGSMFAASEPGQPAASQPPQPVEPAPERVFAQPGDEQLHVKRPPVTKEPLPHPNLDAHLNRVVEETRGATKPTSPDSPASVPSSDPVLVTFYIQPERVADVQAYLEDNSVYLRNVGEDYIEAHIPPALLPAASQRPGVLRINTVTPPHPAQGSTISQGVSLHGADAWHNAGYRGEGVKVGIMDVGFERFSELQQGGELPPNVMARCYFDGPRAPTSRLSDCEVDGDHGTAVAETLIDVAPGVELYIAHPHTAGDVRNAVSWMAEQGVQVINQSLMYSPDGPGDGTSPFSDSPLRTIDAAVSAGITWVNAAGNHANQIWYGAFSDPNNNGHHNFAPQDEGNAFDLEAGDSLVAFIRWDDDWGGADCDLDLELWRLMSDSGEWEFVMADDTAQDGSPNSVPLALIKMEGEVTAADAGSYDLGISKHTCEDEPRWIQLTAWINDDLQYYSPGHHMLNPVESGNPGLLAVGATHYWDTDTIASYSSRGPTIDGRTKPEIIGISCGRSTVIQVLPSRGCWFPGTSQSSPHVAGLVALAQQRFPGYDPIQLARYLMDNAAERGANGPDNTWGHGFAVLPDPSSDTQLTPITNLTAQRGPGFGEVTLSWDAVPQATHYRIGYINMVQDYPRAKDSVTGEWIEAFIYSDVNARNIPIVGGRASYTLRRLEPDDRHAFTVLTSNDVVNTLEFISARYNWPTNSRWTFLD